MSLSMLNNVEKQNFCRLVQIVASCDNDFSEQEKAALEEYRKEMGLEIIEPMEAGLDEVIGVFVQSTEKVRFTVFIETIKLVLKDERYENCERYILDKLARAFDISGEKKSRYLTAIMDAQLIKKREYKKSSTNK